MRQHICLGALFASRLNCSRCSIEDTEGVQKYRSCTLTSSKTNTTHKKSNPSPPTPKHCTNSHNANSPHIGTRASHQPQPPTSRPYAPFTRPNTTSTRYRARNAQPYSLKRPNARKRASDLTRWRKPASTCTTGCQPTCSTLSNNPPRYPYNLSPTSNAPKPTTPLPLPDNHSNNSRPSSA
jgi:hypothetical protein